MIHRATLPELTRKRLTQVLFLQLRLLRWAVHEDKVTRARCEAWLSKHSKLTPRAASIARWLERSEYRLPHLQGFAKGPQLEKEAWSKQVIEEAFRLLRKKHPTGSLNPFHENNKTPTWQKEGARFLRRFYNDLHSGAGLPTFLFEDPQASSFTAQGFLNAFLENNKPRLCVCPACEESGYHTEAREKIQSTIDHYLPKSLYPHLSIHPFNLIPLCSLCNSGVKGDRDPLEKPTGERRKLEEIWLPYREDGLSKRTYLDIRFKGDHRSVEFRGIKPRKGHILGQRIEALAEVFDIPQRWSKRRDEIGHKLFRRMQDYLRHFSPRGKESFVTELRRDLRQMFWRFYEEDLAREPFVFPMMWWLSKLIKEGLISEKTLLAEEIQRWIWFHQNQ